MPKKNPKHQARLGRTQAIEATKAKTIHNWRKITGGILVAGAVTTFIVLFAIYYPQTQQSSQNSGGQSGQTVQDGDQVYIYYQLSYTNGTLIQESDSAAGDEFTMTQSALIPGFYNNVIGMSVGQSKTFTIPACDSHTGCQGYTPANAPASNPGLAYIALVFYVKIVSIASNP